MKRNNDRQHRGNETDTIGRFRDAALAVIAAVDKAVEAGDRGRLMADIWEPVIVAYSTAGVLRLSTPLDEPDAELPSPAVPIQEAEKLTESLREILGSWDANDLSEKRAQSRLSDDIADIYFDLRAVTQSTTAPGPAEVLDWHIAFAHHWGTHALSLLRAYHSLGLFQSTRA